MADDDDDDRPRKRKRDDDDDDDEPRRRSIKKRRADDDGGVGAVIPYRNGMALGAYYAGIFGLIPCIIGLGIFGAVPLILGILGLKKAKADPEARGSAHAWVGIVLGVVELLSGCGVIGFFVFAALNGGRR